MTLIIAANLSDRICISADTRLSRRENGVITTVRDNQLKIEPISDDMVVASAGVARMGSFVINALKKE